MKCKFECACLALLLVLQFCVPVSAAADFTPLEDLDIITPDPEAAGASGIFQEGAFFGPQTVPGLVMPADVSEHPEYDAKERILYQEIEAGLQNCEQEITITPFPVDSQARLVEIYYQVVNDHPELFYCQTALSMKATSTEILFITPKYLYPADEAQEKKAEFDRCVSDALAQAEGIDDPLEKILTLHDYLTVNCKYADPIPKPPSPVFSAYGALVEREAVCQGYALAFKLLMNRIGVPCVLVEGAESMNHIWNAVQLEDGQWYHVDVTWDDPFPDREGYSSHTFFLRSNAKMLTEGTGEGCHYGWDESVVSPWGGSKYDSGWIFNNSKTPLYRFDNNYYYIDALYADASNVYKSDSLQGSGSLVREYLDRDAYCGTLWDNGRLYYVPYTESEALYVMALDLTEETTVPLDAFTRSGTEPVGLRCENGGITVFRSDSGETLGQSRPLPDWRSITASNQTYGLSEDGKYALLDCNAASVTGKTLWIASYDSQGKMTFVGSASDFPPAVDKNADLQMVSFSSSGTPSDSLKAFLLDPVTLAP